ncbi:MAG: MerR family transcriptional regulator [Eubacteriales bacterium]|nr:MerR family transcriptional regulator [Eubacteriales bacterium]
MTIGEFSKQTGICAYTLRFYESKGLIRVKRDSGGRRDYDTNDVEWVQFLQRLKDTGMPLREIKQYADLRYLGPDTMAERMQLLQKHRETVLAQQKKWAVYLENLDHKIDLYRQELAKR